VGSRAFNSGSSPRQFAEDAGFYSASNEKAAHEKGVELFHSPPVFRVGLFACRLASALARPENVRKGKALCAKK